MPLNNKYWQITYRTFVHLTLNGMVTGLLLFSSKDTKALAALDCYKKVCRKIMESLVRKVQWKLLFFCSASCSVGVTLHCSRMLLNTANQDERNRGTDSYLDIKAFFNLNSVRQKKMLYVPPDWYNEI